MYLIILILMFSTHQNIKIDLNKEAAPWRIVNDGVMGGLSQGKIDYRESSIVFHGQLSLENNGGFSWMKSSGVKINLGDFTKVHIRVKGDGRSYDFTLEDSAYSRLYFKQTFETSADQWTIVELPLDNFVQKFFGRLTGRTLDKNTLVQQLGFLLNDKKSGSFALEIDYIEFI